MISLLVGSRTLMEDTRSWRNRNSLLVCHFGWHLTTIQILSIISGLIAADDSLTKCDVGVALPWESNTYIAEESSIRINCTTDASQNPGWTIQLPGRTATLQFTFQASIRTLNDNGFYQLSELDIGMNIKTIRLLIINGTIGINGTVVRCDDIGTGNMIMQTKLIVYEPTPVNLLSVDVGIQTANISWSPSTPPVSPMTEDVNQTYTLTVTSNKVITLPQIFQLHQPYYVFTAPDGAPPCEVYNFSVTATYVGATYFGPACSEPSQMLNRMLPSLPDIGMLNFSYILVMIAGEIKLNVSFESALFCEDYPVSNYTLEIQNTSDSEVIMHSIVPQHSNLIGRLSENTEYSFRVLAANAVGTVSSSSRQLYTTDVQFITAIHDEDRDILLQCDFILGSVAQGCKVVLVGESENITVNLTRFSNTACAMEIFELPLTIDVIYVFGYDIENDGSIGTLAIPGKLNESQSMPCMPPSVVTVPSGTDINSWLSLIIGIIVVAVIIFAASLALGVTFLMVKRFKSSASGDPSSRDGLATTVSQRNLKKEEETSQPHYAEPLKSLQEQKAQARTPGDGADKLSCEHKEENCTKIAEEHIYHVLENQRDCIKLESIQPPIYQDVTEISANLKGEEIVKNEYACIN